jgi:peptidoglycan/LPS O-acetylase OafA/YrhL
MAAALNGSSSALLEERRLDIDLLRAVAVLAVIFFHLGVRGFAGGFVGVDVFFVISGFLISRQVRARIEAGSFSYAGFLGRRARRLVPAFAATLLASAVVGLVVLAPDTHRHLLRELHYASGYVSNFMYWLESGYFDAVAMTKPLLHSWSLAVEEQFYFCWPAVLLLLSRSRRLVWWYALALASFVACEWVLRVDPSAAFYLFPCRIFEFVIGALIPCYCLPSRRGVRALFDGVAVVALLAPMLLLDRGSHFPGASVLPSCLGTAWLIAARPRWLNARHPVSAVGGWIGRISYSAYLVHWPLLVFVAQFRGEEFSPVTKLALFAATLVLADVMWRLVERPALESKLPVLAFLPAVPATFGIVYMLTLLAPAAYQWVHADRRQLDVLVEGLEPREGMLGRLLPAMGIGGAEATRISVLGDSHAEDGALALQTGAGTAAVVHILHSVCDPLTESFDEAGLASLYATHHNVEATPQRCGPYHRSLLDRLAAQKPDMVVFSEHWRPDALPYLVSTIRRIHRRTGAAVVILGPNQEFSDTPGRLLRRVSEPSQINRMAWARRIDHSDIIAALRRIARETDSVFVDKQSLVCPVRGVCDYASPGALNYWDNSHWTERGIHLFGERLVRRLADAGLLGLHPERVHP